MIKCPTHGDDNNIDPHIESPMKDNILNQEIEKCFEQFDASIMDVQKAYQKVWRQIDSFKLQESLPKNYLSEMAGNLAHEIRNPLCGIANLVTLLSEDDESLKSRGVHGILEGVQRIDKIVENLIFFSQPVVIEKINCDLCDIVRSAVATAIREWQGSNRVEFLVELPKHEVFIKVDPELMLKVAKNLIRNALENMPGGGRIFIELKQRKAQFDLLICDEGRGLAVEDTEKPFYPFYTTKTYGMGLGLSISRLVLEEHGYKINLRNNKDKGVTVTITYPMDA
ncbi:HAMP domain-containing histidine kinase [bacterium]|nr:HAMP domain-containing histidine kinase [bacterium]